MNGTSREYPARPLVGVGVVLLRPAGAGAEVLLVRRLRAPAAGEWSFPGGAQWLGETAEAAARRELLEETGLVAGQLHLAAHADAIHRDAEGVVQFHYTILDFCGVWAGGEPVAGGDAGSVTWADTASLNRYAVSPQIADIVALCVCGRGHPG
jgi:ADP-ribose pyrophosphatase YjhB (NUDIX family)